MFCQKKHFFYLKLHKYGREKGSFLYIQCPFFDFFYRCLDAVFSYGVFEEKLKFNHITISREDLNLKNRKIYWQIMCSMFIQTATYAKILFKASYLVIKATF